MRINSEYVLNEIYEGNSQYEKHSEQRIWTWRWTVIDLREEQREMHFFRCVSIPNLSQMKSMNVICNMKSMNHKGFEHDEELWLIWESNKNKMFSNWCMSIRNLCQMRSMKVCHNGKNILNKEFKRDEEF
jgi:hypothetical protein